MTRALVLGALVAGAAAFAPAAAQTGPAPHSIPWFEARPAERAATLRACRDDLRLGRGAVCANATHADERAGARRRAARTRTVDDVLADPTYYAANRVARAVALSECASGGFRGGTRPDPRQCAAARAGAAMDPGSGGRGRGP